MRSICTLLMIVFGVCRVSAQDSVQREPFQPDEHTIALYHFDEGEGNETHDAMGDQELTLHAIKQALWSEHPGFGAAARFERRKDDANLLLGPINNDKLHLRSCTKEWTVEAWVRYTGKGGQDNGHTLACICGTDDEGFGLPLGMRGGWNFALYNGPKKGPLKNGISPSARFMGSPRGNDPNHDTSGLLFPDRSPDSYTGAKPAFITDNQWRHVAWQFRYSDQTHFFLLDGQVVRRMGFPLEKTRLRKVKNDAEDVCVPFTVGGLVHSQDPPFYINYGNFAGEIDELRISNVMRYPVAEHLSIIGQELPTAGLNVPYSVQLSADVPRGDVSWEIIEGQAPAGLKLDSSTGLLHGKAAVAVEPQTFVVRAIDQADQSDQHAFSLGVERGRIATSSLPPAFPDHPYQATLKSEHMAGPVQWAVRSGQVPQGIQLNANTGQLQGAPTDVGNATICFEVTDANGLKEDITLTLRVLPEELRVLGPDEHTVVLYDWQGPNGRIMPDLMGDKDLTLTWTNMGGDRRVSWPGREGRFPQDTGHGEHGWVTSTKGNPKLDLKTCADAWTVEAWVRRGGAFQGFGNTNEPFHFGHICGSYDTTAKGVWELYLSDINSPDGSMAPGLHFCGEQPDQALMNLHPWHRPEGIVGDPKDAAIRDTEWHHVAWQYNYAEDLHQLFLDGKLIWRMNSPDGRKLVNNRQHDAQFSIISRIKGWARLGGAFNFGGFGHFFGQVGEIRISNVRRYGDGTSR
ncbi:putative Ig domain-containing protein [Blastopirellula sp. J2-11]|uniref:putative Ig domain-containing protein n=1 Tax=Blastopirellula sp. J2-11 TaxID=2943192 RepID=UPI0021C9DC47|nr:putative Ig domain-containing protein [Blastopirellula sp. J2-11]UUO04535.1 putative Ig domain-containing protein [Blastopirellula sp. J2-11]